jgi:hypothetical protein
VLKLANTLKEMMFTVYIKESNEVAMELVEARQQNNVDEIEKLLDEVKDLHYYHEI